MEKLLSDMQHQLESSLTENDSFVVRKMKSNLYGILALKQELSPFYSKYPELQVFVDEFEERVKLTCFGSTSANIDDPLNNELIEKQYKAFSDYSHHDYSKRLGRLIAEIEQQSIEDAEVICKAIIDVDQKIWIFINIYTIAKVSFTMSEAVNRLNSSLRPNNAASKKGTMGIALDMLVTEAKRLCEDRFPEIQAFVDGTMEGDKKKTFIHELQKNRALRLAVTMGRKEVEFVGPTKKLSKQMGQARQAFCKHRKVSPGSSFVIGREADSVVIEMRKQALDECKKDLNAALENGEFEDIIIENQFRLAFNENKAALNTPRVRFRKEISDILAITSLFETDAAARSTLPPYGLGFENLPDRPL